MHRDEHLVVSTNQTPALSKLPTSRRLVRQDRGPNRIRRATFGSIGLFAAGVVATSILSGPSRAASWVPAPVAFDSALIEAAVLAPPMPDRVYAALKRIGVYRSDDRGESWLAAGTGLPLDADVRSLAVASTDADRVFAGIDGQPGGSGRVFSSGNGGTSWAETGEGIDGQLVTSLLPQSVNPEVILAGLRSGNTPGVYRTTDGGASWSLSVAGLGQVDIWSLAESPDDPSLFLAGTGDGAARSTDGGVTWTPGTNPGFRFVDLAWSTANADVVYAAALSQLFRSDDGGITFNPLSSPSLAQSVTEVVAHPTAPLTVFVAGSVYCPPFGEASAVWQSVNQGSSWFPVYTPSDYYPFVGCDRAPAELLIDPDNPQTTLYLGRSGLAEGLWRGGLTGWTVEVDGLRNYGVDRVRAGHNGAIYARNLTQLLRTQNPESSWQMLDQEFWSFDLSLEANHSTPGLLDEVGAATTTDVVGPLARRSTNGGTTWSHGFDSLPPGLATDAPLTLVVSNGADGQSVYVWALTRCHRSDDGFESFVEVSDQIEATAAVIDPVDPGRLFAAQAQSPVMNLSTDAGVTWTARSTGLPVETPVALFMDPENSARLVVVLDQQGAYETTDAGLSWSSTFPTSESIRDADFDPESGYIYLATREAGVLTNDPRMVGGGLPTQDVLSLTYSPVHDVLVAGTQYGGLFVQRADLSSVDGEASPVVWDDESMRRLIAGDRLQVTASPNPSRNGASFIVRSLDLAAEGAPRNLAETSGNYLTIRDVDGRLVRQLELVPGPDTWESKWDGRDAAADPVPAGVYFVYAKIGSRQGSGKLLLLK